MHAVLPLLAALAAPPLVPGGAPAIARRVDPPAAAGAIAPSLARVGDRVVMTWVEPIDGDGLRRLAWSALDDGAWTAPRTIVESTAFFANWADVPRLAVAPDGAWTVSWARKSGPGTYAYDVALARSADDGRTWTSLGAAHDDGTETEHGFVSLVPEDDGVRAFWLDGRRMAGDGADYHGHGGGLGTMTLRTAIVGTAVRDGARLDICVCECCNTDAALTTDGPIIVYRDRSLDDIRDIALVRRTADGWREPVRVADDDWAISACPVNGPAVAARGRLVAVAWYTGAAETGAVRAAFSVDGGATFGPPIDVDDTSPVGRVDLHLSPSGSAIVAWLDTAPGPHGGAIRLRRVSPGGAMGAATTITSAGPDRGTGFPRLLALDADRLLLAWTDGSEGRDHARLRAAIVEERTIAPLPAD